MADICSSIEKVSGDALRDNAQLNSEIVLDIKKLTEKLQEILKLIQDDSEE